MNDLSATERFEAALAAAGDQRFVLRLFVAGASPGSRRAIDNLTRVCEQELRGRYTLEVIDIYQRPELAAEEQLVALPTLVRLLPEPIARVVGDLTDDTAVLAGLEVLPPRSG